MRGEGAGAVPPHTGRAGFAQPMGLGRCVSAMVWPVSARLGRCVSAMNALVLMFKASFMWQFALFEQQPAASATSWPLGQYGAVLQWARHRRSSGIARSRAATTASSGWSGGGVVGG